MALAYAWLCHIYWEGAQFWFPEQEAYPKAKDAVMNALELDDTLAEAHKEMGWIKLQLDWDFSGAEKEFRKALEIAPGNILLQFDFIVFLGSVGKFDEAIAGIKRIEQVPMLQGELDSNLNKIYLWAGRYDEALERAKRAAVSKPGFSSNYNLSQAYSFKGMHAEALSVVDKIMASLGAQEDQYLLDNQAQILARSGRREEALKILEKANALRAQNNIDSSYPMATIYAGLGDKDVAFKYLYETHEKHISMITFLMVDPCLHGLHDDPRFKDLLNKIGFE